jgi:hypothetical protein
MQQKSRYEFSLLRTGNSETLVVPLITARPANKVARRVLRNQSKIPWLK